VKRCSSHILELQVTFVRQDDLMDITCLIINQMKSLQSTNSSIGELR